MSDTEFFRTGMGRTFYEGTMPALVRELAKLNKNLERVGDIILYGNSREQIATSTAKVPDSQHDCYDKFSALVNEARSSGEASGRVLGDHLMDVWNSCEGNGYVARYELVQAEAENLHEWAAYLIGQLKKPT